MVISTRVYVEHPDLALVRTIRTLPAVDVGVVSTAGTDPQHDVHWFWVEAPDFDAFEDALAADHTVASFSALPGAGSRRTYQIEYSDDAKLMSPAVAAAGGLLLKSRSHATGWVLELQLQDHDALYELDRYAASEDIQFDVMELHQVDPGSSEPAFGLTEPQIEALVNAYFHGYYDEPREATLAELAALMDISQTAVSGRLRRGSARLIEAVLVDADDGDERGY